MKTVYGDLITLAKAGDFDVIVHGCNCFHGMGNGIAKAIKARFPEAYAADLATVKGSREKLGTISFATVNEADHGLRAESQDDEIGARPLTIVNAYTQYRWSGKSRVVDYEAIRAAFAAIKSQFAGQRIGYPMIGAGLAGGEWKIIAKIIDEELKGENHTVVKFRRR